MKKIISAVFVFSLVLVLAACGGSGSDKKSSEDKNQLVVGASNTPHAEILEKAKPILKKRRH